VDVGDRQYGDRGCLVGHVVGVRAPHHHRAGPDRLDELDGDLLPVRGAARGEHVPPCGTHHDLEADQAAPERLQALPAADPARVILDPAAQRPVTVAVEASRDRADAVPRALAGGRDEEREARRPPVGGVENIDDQVDVLAQRIGVVGL